MPGSGLGLSIVRRRSPSGTAGWCGPAHAPEGGAAFWFRSRWVARPVPRTAPVGRTK